jgi:hypothetical protein
MLGRSRYVREAYQAPVEVRPWQDLALEPQSFDMIAGLHFRERVTDVDAAFKEMVVAARRYLLFVVSEGWQIWNADHWWMLLGIRMRIRRVHLERRDLARPECWRYCSTR